MTPRECPFEEEVLAAALQSRWPDRVGTEMRDHLAACQSCRELVQVVSAIAEAREEVQPSVSVPDSGRIWWQAQLRARREAVEAAGRPITAAHVIAFACAAGLAGACFGATSEWFQSALRRAVTSLPSATALLAEHWVLAAGMAFLIFVLPAAVYFATGRDS